MLRRLIQQLRTVRYVKPSQIGYYIMRRYLPPRRVDFSATLSLRKSQPSEPPSAISGIYVNDSTFRFLNSEVDLGDVERAVDWSALSQPRLWRYNLHYFDYLRELARPAHNKDYLIQSWIEENPQGSEPGWEPFTISLRIVNWIFYMLRRRPAEIPAAWLDSLYLQTLWLEKNDERHILANHYFENLKALVFAGCFFDGTDANRWVRRAFNAIQKQLREQTLGDGGHYERSHQYHCLMLENYLDILNLSKAYPDLCPGYFIDQVQTSATRGLGWLTTTLFPDGMIPLFNDSAFGVSIAPIDIFAYAERLSLNVNLGKSKFLNLIDCPDSGLYGCRVDNDMFIIDCGDIGPSYQPGHTHCDFLSYELMLANQRVVIDSGVCEYEPGPLRDYVRSTKAHNTVSVDGGEQSEIWGEFRVARRAKKQYAAISQKPDVIEFSGTYTGFFDVKGQIMHNRNVVIAISPDGQNIRRLTITDHLTGAGRHVVESFIHIHPDLALKLSGNSDINIVLSRSTIASIRILECQDYRIEQSVYCPEFGKRIPNQVIIVRTQGNLPLSIRYEIRNHTRRNVLVNAS